MSEENSDTVSEKEFKPFGTAYLLGIYFLILVLLWVFMYFVEFLGDSPTILSH